MRNMNDILRQAQVMQNKIAKLQQELGEHSYEATSGGGIPLAIVGGRIAGEAAAGYLRGEERLEDYPSRINKEFGIQLARSVQIRKMVDLAMKSDRLMNSLFSALSPAQMKSVMRAQIPEIFLSRAWTGEERSRQN